MTFWALSYIIVFVVLVGWAAFMSHRVKHHRRRIY